MDLLIFSETLSPRLEYVFNHIFVNQLGLQIKFTTQIKDFLNSNTPKLSYARNTTPNSMFFQAHSLLYDNTIVEQDINLSTYKKTPIFFLSSNSKSALPFDPFAATFYMLSRYEEYLCHQKDTFFRFPAHESLAFQNKFLQIPVVDRWIFFIKEILSSEYPNLNFREHNFTYLNTIDVDNAFAYLEKGFFRTIGSFMRSIIQLNYQDFFYRLNVLFFHKKDPYDTYDTLLAIHNKYNLKTIIFFLLANYGRLDKNVSHKSKKYQSLIQYLNKFFDVGVHASYASNSNPKNLHLEIDRLSSIIGSKITKNRQHYIKLNLPHNYQNLIANNICEDYSMGFSSEPGFRAGTSHSFNFFNLKDNTTTNLLLHPFCVMDVTLMNYLKLKPEKALSTIKLLVDEVKKVNGCFISIWHNESFIDSISLNKWRTVYEDMIRYSLDERN
tara:strand:- start:134 stop:1453 length:1320 start_codon:yes stop_codon:yes gene_type:complete